MSITAGVGDLVRRVPAHDPPQVYRRPVEHLGGLARERHGLDSPEDVDRLHDRVVTQPRRRPVGRAPVDEDAGRQHALGLDADVQVGRLAGDREVAHVAAPHEVVARADRDVLGLLVGDDHEPHADVLLLDEVVRGAHHRRQPALHVVGAAAVQPVALGAWLELLGVAGDDVQVAVEDDRRDPFRPDRGGQRVEVAEPVRLDLDVARLEPPLDEPGCGVQALGRRRVVGDQSLGQNPFIHSQEGSGA